MPRAKRPCSVPGCPALLDKAGRCTEHQREAEKARGSRQARGYDAAHEHLRTRLLPYAYGQLCPSCQQRMLPGQALHLMHNAARTGYLGMGHSWCNMSDAGKAAHKNR